MGPHAPIFSSQRAPFFGWRVVATAFAVLAGTYAAPLVLAACIQIASAVCVLAGRDAAYRLNCSRTIWPTDAAPAAQCRVALATPYRSR